MQMKPTRDTEIPDNLKATSRGRTGIYQKSRILEPTKYLYDLHFIKALDDLVIPYKPVTPSDIRPYHIGIDDIETTLVEQDTTSYNTITIGLKDIDPLLVQSAVRKYQDAINSLFLEMNPESLVDEQNTLTGTKRSEGHVNTEGCL